MYREEATFLDRSVFIGAFLGDRLIGFVKLVSDETGTQADLMNILSMVAHRDKAPTNAFVARRMRSLVRSGYLADGLCTWTAISATRSDGRVMRAIRRSKSLGSQAARKIVTEHYQPRCRQDRGVFERRLA